jgi:hypothetical protein
VKYWATGFRVTLETVCGNMLAEDSADVRSEGDILGQGPRLAREFGDPA